MDKNLFQDIVNQKKRLVIWGVGYIGLSNILAFAEKGISCIGIDNNPEVVTAIQNKEHFLHEFTYWVGYDYSYFSEHNLMDVRTNWRTLAEEDIVCHFISIPTEKNNEPYLDILYDVIYKIIDLSGISNNKPIILIESTVIPGTGEKVEELLNKEMKTPFYYGISPRRDWFLSNEKNLRNLARIYGGNSEEATQKIHDVLSIVCDNLICAPDYRHAEATKSFENAFRHLDITFANQLADAYPHLNIREVLRLCGTKWNVETYYPSFGTGGYCIPLSSKYVLAGATNQMPTLMEEVIAYERQRPLTICDILLKRNVTCVGILGISYKENIKVDKYSSSIRIIEAIKQKDVDIFVSDPYYSDLEILNICKSTPFSFLNYIQYQSFDALILNTPHRKYYLIKWDELISHLVNCKTIFDNTGAWRQHREVFDKAGIEYKLIGDVNWNT